MPFKAHWCFSYSAFFFFFSFSTLGMPVHAGKPSRGRDPFSSFALQNTMCKAVSSQHSAETGE